MSTVPLLVTVQTDGVVELNVTGIEDVDVADTVKFGAVDSLSVNGPKVMVCAVGAVLVTVNDDVTACADAHSFPVPSTPPDCDARMVHVPDPVNVTVEPVTVHTLGVVD
jgi:hypothetical protein